MKREFIKRVVLETIQKKVSDLSSNKTVEIRLASNDFVDSFNHLPIIFFDDIPEAVIELETDTKGKISLISPLPVKTGDPAFSDIPDYYRISYNPNASPKETITATGDPFFFYLSRSKGLYRAPSGVITEIYPLKNDDDRFRILMNLTKEPQDTSMLAVATGIIPDKLRPQIKGIRKQIEDHFTGIKGTDFIFAKQGEGYRLGDKITLKIIE